VTTDHDFDLERALTALHGKESIFEDDGFTDRVISRLPPGFSSRPVLGDYIVLITVTVSLVLLVWTIPIQGIMAQIGHALATLDFTSSPVLLLVTCAVVLMNEVRRIWQ
jgi:hypothetical protein